MERSESDFDRSDRGRMWGDDGGVRVGHLIAELHTGHDDGSGGHGVNRLKGARHGLPPVGNKLFEKATNQLICLTRSRLVALGQGGTGPLFFHILYVKHNIEELWNFIFPRRPRLSPPVPKPPCSRRK